MKRVLLLLALLVPSHAWAVVDLYVDTDSGNNGNACTAAGSSACATLNGAYGKIPGTISDAYIIHCKGSAADTSTIVINTSGTSSSNTITIQVDTADRHAGVWDSSKYHMEADLTTDGRFIDITVPYVRITGLQLYNSNVGTANQHIIRVTSGASTGNTHISKVILRGARFQVDLFGVAAGHTVYMWNSIGYGWSTTSGGILIFNGGTFYVYSVTSGGSSASQNFRRDGGTVHIKNCYSPTFHGDGSYTTHLTSGAVDTTGTSATLDSVAYSATNFQNVTAGSENLSLQSGSVLVNNGTDTSGESAPLNFTDDIAGNTRSTWDVGAFEFVSASTFTPFNRRVQ